MKPIQVLYLAAGFTIIVLLIVLSVLVLSSPAAANGFLEDLRTIFMLSMCHPLVGMGMYGATAVFVGFLALAFPTTKRMTRLLRGRVFGLSAGASPVPSVRTLLTHQ